VGICQESAVDLVGEATTQGTDGLGLGVASGDAVLDIGMPGPVLLELRNGNTVQRRIQLAVASTIETYPLGVA
jgi:hypothetical protein